jgi:tryptophanyl-tRNA synthetase
MTDNRFTPRVFSGIKPSGGLTLGNYLGAIKRWVGMQDEGGFETIYCVVDLHAITVWQDPQELRAATREVAAGMLASGIDPERSILFNQSQVHEHAELGWIFNCVARVGWMDRMTQWKERRARTAKSSPWASTPIRR